MITGSGGGSKQNQRSPTEEKDSLRSRSSAKLLDLICEGEIGGLVNGEQSIYLDNTPIQNPNGSSNFTGVTTSYRPGTQTQSYIPGVADGVESEVSVDVEVKKSTGGVIRTIANTNIDAVKVRISIPALTEYKKNGDLVGSSVRFQISTKTNNGSFVLRRDETITGKASSQYEAEYYLPLDSTSSITTLKVERITDDSVSLYLQNKTVWASYTEIIEAKFNYPNSALVGLTFDAEQFSSIPSRAYDIKGLKIRIPVNATVRTDGSLSYSGPWNGTFKIAWSSDPAWCLYDLLTSSRYGAGIPLSQIDKWAFYPISQYCSTLVDDGFGSREPRFSLNCYIQAASEAYELITALASVLRGMIYWAEGGITIVQDAPANPVRQFVNANVSKFEYSGSSKRSRHTIALVTWNDPEDFYRQKVETVEDRDSLILYGARETRITAFGCTSRGQAHRVGKWLLFSERLETETVTFETGAEGIPVRPGEIITVGDTKRSGQRHWGRILSATTNNVTIDFPVNLISGANELSVVMPDGSLETRIISNHSGYNTVIGVMIPFSALPPPDSTWVIATGNLKPQLFRVIGISEVEPHRYKITALVHNQSKYAAVESDTYLQSLPTRSTPPIPPNLPRNLKLTPYFVQASNGQQSLNLRLDWETPILSNGKIDPFTVGYKAQIRRGRAGAWYGIDVQSTGADFTQLMEGDYYARVSAIDATNNQSAWLTLPMPQPLLYVSENLVAQFNSVYHTVSLGVL